MKRFALNAVAAAALALAFAPGAHAGLVNSGFEAITVDSSGFGPPGSTNWDLIPQTTAGMGWKTTATDGLIEIWKAPGAIQPGGGQSIPAFQGNQYAELNATQASSLFQDATFFVGDKVSWTFAHRGRVGVDVAAVTITDLGVDGLFGTADDIVKVNINFADGTAGWGVHTSADAGSGGDITITNTNKYRFAFSAISSAGGNLLEGNLIDAADFGVGVIAPVSEPGSAALAGIALLGAAAVTRRRKV